MKAAGMKKKKKSIFLRVALAAFSIYVVVMLVQLQLEFSEQQKDYNQKTAAAEKLKKEIEELKKQSKVFRNRYKNNNSEDYMEEKAREQGMARPGETIYIEIPGN